MKYYNITKDLDFVLSEDKKYTKNEIIEYIQESFQSDGFEIVNITKLEKSLTEIRLKIDGKEFAFVTLIRNITGAGWESKPKFKRVQVNNLQSESPNMVVLNEKMINLILGYYNYDNNPILVCWDLYRYLNHKTVRSCYVTVDTLKRGYEKEYYEGVDSGQAVWVFKANYAKHFFINYLKYLEENRRVLWKKITN